MKNLDKGFVKLSLLLGGVLALALFGFLLLNRNTSVQAGDDRYCHYDSGARVWSVTGNDNGLLFEGDCTPGPTAAQCERDWCVASFPEPTPTSTPPVFHNECDGNSCIQVQGEGSDDCTEDTDCEGEPVFHNECIDYSCVDVEGEGEDSCNNNQDCEGEVSPTPTIPEPTPTAGQSNGGGGGGASAPVCNNTSPVAPRILSATSIGGNSIKITWTKVTPADSYTILYGTTSGNYPYSVFSTGDTDNFVINGITTGCFSIKAVNGCMPGPLSTELCSGGVLGASTGSVLGASTMGATGGLTEASINLIAQIGLVLIGLGLIRLPLKHISE
jgi:hypothetical protein